MSKRDRHTAHLAQVHDGSIPIAPSSARPAAADIARGVKVGLTFAVGFSLLSLVIFALSGGGASDRKGLTLGQVLTAYFAAGILSGAVGGMLLRVAARYPLLAYPVGVVAAFPGAMAITAVISHQFNGWGEGEWFTAVLSSVIYGIIGVRVARS